MTQEQLRSILSENIKIRRKKLNISQSKLAEMINMSSNYVTDIETQRTWVSDSTLVKIAAALGVEVYELLKPHTNNEIVNESAIKESAVNILQTIKAELPNSAIRFDGLVTLSNGTIYIPVIPSTLNKEPNKGEIAKSLGTERRNFKAKRAGMSHTCIMQDNFQNIKWQFD